MFTDEILAPWDADVARGTVFSLGLLEVSRFPAATGRSSGPRPNRSNHYRATFRASESTFPVFTSPARIPETPRSSVPKSLREYAVGPIGRRRAGSSLEVLAGLLPLVSRPPCVASRKTVFNRKTDDAGFHLLEDQSSNLLLRSQGERYKPTFSCSLWQASTNWRTTSPCPPFHGEFLTECSV